jgi:16S rRNA (guanine966-N2)-methyltransferase
MRIVAGRWRGRRIRPPSDSRVRPTADRVREAWMSIVQPDLPDAHVVDLFAGSGALGLEALSRGAAHATFVEVAPRSLRALAENIAALGAGADADVRRGDALAFARKLDAAAFDIAFADPPYGLGLAERLVQVWRERPFARLLCVEHPARERLATADDVRTYGDTAVSFFRAE